MEKILITGANRGVGLELTRQLLARNGHVFASCREPDEAEALQSLKPTYAEQLTIIDLDVSDDDSVERAAHVVAGETSHLDWLINNAGVLYRGESLDDFDPGIMLETFDVNTVGAMRVAAQFADLLRKGTAPKLLNISSNLGSLRRAIGNGSYSYNASKAALNMITRMLAHDLAPDGITVVSIHPGWVQTDMGGKNATVTVTDSARGIIRLADSLTMDETSSFHTFTGDTLPW